MYVFSFFCFIFQLLHLSPPLPDTDPLPDTAHPGRLSPTAHADSPRPCHLLNWRSIHPGDAPIAIVGVPRRIAHSYQLG